MIFGAFFVLALTDRTLVPQPAEAAQFHQTTANVGIGGNLKDAEKNGCQLPPPLENGRYTPSHRRCLPRDTSPACQMVPGTWVPKDWPIFYQCDPGYLLNITDEHEKTERTASICHKRKWTPALPVCEETHLPKDLAQLTSLSHVCGKPSDNLDLRTNREVPGTVSRKGAWPWMVMFGMPKNNTDSGEIHWFCAGTLITTRHILTAAHCVAWYRSRNTFFARINDINLDDPSDNEGVIEVEIQRTNIAVHPVFKKEKVFSHNIAIIKLNADLPITDFVRPICLPTPDFAVRSFDNETAYFTTWSQTDNDREWKRKRRYQPILRKLSATIVKHADCNYNYRNYESDDFIIVGWDLICASVPSNKSCQGDGGSPLMLKVKDSYVLIGIVATPFRCYDQQFPRLFTRLSRYMEWVFDNIKI